MTIRNLRLPGHQSLGALLLVVAGLGLITFLHYSTAPALRQLHTVYRYFYFLPIVYAALRFGLWGGLLASLGASLFYAPLIFFKWGNFPGDSLNDLLVVAVFYGVAIITGITTDRLRKSEARQTLMAAQLSASLHRLENQGEELRRAERMSALGTLASGLAHEIRNPVGIIRATAQLMVMESGSAAYEMATVIQQESDRIERLIQDLLNYAGGGRLQCGPTDVAALLEQVAGRLRPLVEAHHLDLKVDVSDHIPPACLDREQVEQALVNLCMNAIQAMGDTGHLWLRAGWSSSPEPMLTLKVADTGPGIAPTVRSHIFDPFFSTKESGTGLGLSVVQRIVADHNGRVWVESELGEGSTFVIQLPLDHKNDGGPE